MCCLPLFQLSTCLGTRNFSQFGGQGYHARVPWSRKGGCGQSGGGNPCTGERAKLFWLEIYCAKPRPNPGYHSGSWSCRLLVRQSPWIMWEYNLATAIAILALNQSYIFRHESAQMCAYEEGLLDKHANIDLVSAYHVYLSSPSSNESGAFPLVPSCRFLHPSRQIWRG